MKTKTYWFIISALSLVCIGLGIALYFNNSAMSGHAANLESVYQKSLYELIDSVNSMEVEVSKMLVSGDYDSQRKSLSSIKQQSASAQNCLSYLPVGSNLVVGASKFVNQLNGYCTSILNGTKTSLSEEDMETWDKIYDCVASLKYELNKVSQKISQGYSIIDNLDKAKDIDGFSQNFSGISGDSIEYPSMIYDGPFSDSLLNQKINGLGSDKCTEADAKEYIKQVFDTWPNVSIEYVSKTAGKFTTYNFNVKSNGIKYFAQVTEQGKFLLNISGMVSDDKIIMTEEDAILRAEEFAVSLKLDNMKCVWKATVNNITYINLAPIEGGIIFYPDLIKVKIDRTNGNIMGWEASNYAYNHTKRTSLDMLKTESDILAQKPSKLSVNSIKKCIIPLEYGGECLAYEVCGKYNNFTYYIYYDASNGKQIKVMRVIQTSDGELLL